MTNSLNGERDLSKSHRLGFVGNLAKKFIDSKLTPLIILVALLLGIGATLILPREEEPQITVPMADVFVQMPGASAKDVEQRVTSPMEKLIKELPGVEYVYSTSRPGSSLAIVRFFVGQKTEDAIVQLYNKLYANFDKIPPGASQPLIKSRAIDDVPILTLTLWGEQSNAAELRQIAAQLNEQIKQVPDVSETTLIGGQKRQLRVELDPIRLNAFGLTPLEIAQALQSQNAELASGAFSQNNRSFLVRTQSFIRSAEDAKGLVVSVAHNQPVYLRDVATVTDGAEEPASYVFFGQGAANKEQKTKSLGETDAVTIAIAKRPGANAIQVSHHVLRKLDHIKRNYIPQNVHLTVTRDYGETAAERSNELLFHMLIAVGSVTVLMWWALGKKEAMVVAVSIPVTLALTLASFVFYGFTLNRVTFFALIFSIGILVDDAIVVVENVGRHLQIPENKTRLQLSTNRRRTLQQIVLEAVDEVGNPTILATLAVIAAILPMAFVGGLMGPYMRPIPLGASAAMIFSALVAFIVVPWTTVQIFSNSKHHTQEHGEDALSNLYRRFMRPLVHYPLRGTTFLTATALALVIIIVGLAGMRLVILKMLPYDNKSELQVIVNMPEDTTLEQTARVTREMAQYLATVPYVLNYQSYVGTASPYNFNGLVRHYFLRSGTNIADIQVNFLPKGERDRQSHDIAKMIRPKLKEIGDRYNARVQVAEIPPGPPVLQTLVTEIYGPDYNEQIELAKKLRKIYQNSAGVVDVDWYVEAPQTDYRLIIDREKATLNGINPTQISQVLQIALSGQNVGLLHDENAREDVAINLRFNQASRTSLEDLKSLKLKGANGNIVPLSTLVKPETTIADYSIYHKNLQPVVYVMGDVSGKVESAVYAMLNLQPQIDKLVPATGAKLQTYLTEQPPSTETYAIKWDGEWQVTYEVFRDLGIAFAVVLVLIYALVVGWFQSFVTPLVIMAAIPFSLVGIMPAHWLMGSFFTATSMIGFIAGAGIVVRNSIILVDFIELRLKEGMPLEDAVIDAGAVRFRPMLLTAAAVIVGSAIILADPIFQGLAISLMAGEVASLLLSRSAVPILYYKVWRNRKSNSTNSLGEEGKLSTLLDASTL
ncbi:efflux RND transporter permease subunit [Aetokthonos hydrillicola Thurmond2011]|jgi:multidrug efflux pump subunit AcrB|uniref:Efflux RND transporter permease subunit n=1 Tax=Aetokthonos hydrillicola Thurmond2011 TaxID=2712845 RepID=A0AAP5IEJ4_9CYAN|nr:efflux RND transporter permease subunit [Aetokthonos hydrillicola]MBO3459624.1 efflux RND transporter permease subunit [Aetokthonos hydrillicola CCALA 1050]MBW4588986.1 efflux RND transporter permease subunit [Aetokthonos hydrillicola CCALA 1050]MDR9900061.1 efflux RND transporter permease subunit [Aetokthonos hydrillicola Thurmond2011]